MKEFTTHFFEELQKIICSELEKIDSKSKFTIDNWSNSNLGSGKTCIIESGNVFEKGGVNFSRINSQLSEKLAQTMNSEKQNIFATGISLVLHPCNPMVPTVHMNLRYIELENGDRWFGGGVDLTPSYLFHEDSRHFHTVLKSICDRYDLAYYPRFKKLCDMYFYLKHRGETRGIGGIFFDYQREDPEKCFEFIKAVGSGFLQSYIPIVERRKTLPWSSSEKEWQLIRRGRYVEFNLIYDRGTLFGLETGGRSESILMTLPPEVKWKYDFSPSSGSREAELVSVLQHPIEWV